VYILICKFLLTEMVSLLYSQFIYCSHCKSTREFVNEFHNSTIRGNVDGMRILATNLTFRWKMKSAPALALNTWLVTVGWMFPITEDRNSFLCWNGIFKKASENISKNVSGSWLQG